MRYSDLKERKKKDDSSMMLLIRRTITMEAMTFQNLSQNWFKISIFDSSDFMSDYLMNNNQTKVFPN